jgi:hypothetical protein
MARHQQRSRAIRALHRCPRLPPQCVDYGTSGFGNNSMRPCVRYASAGSPSLGFDGERTARRAGSMTSNASLVAYLGRGQNGDRCRIGQSRLRCGRGMGSPDTSAPSGLPRTDSIVLLSKRFTYCCSCSMRYPSVDASKQSSKRSWS